MNIVGRAREYLLSHWRGEQSLARSFWINLVALRASIFIAQDRLEPENGDDHAARAIAVLSLIVLVHGAVLIWQLVGTLRAAERDLVASGAPAPAWGAQLGATVLCFLTLAYAVEGWQMTRALPDEEPSHVRMERERLARYSLDIDAIGTTLALRGTIERGVTRRVEALLERTPAIARVTFDSPGGNVHEARGLSRVLREHELASHVDGRCASACTVAFIGGHARTLGAQGALGFHRYRLEDEYAGLRNDPEEAQRLDQALFRRAGVADAFVERLHERPPDGMWWPTAGQLLEAGVVDRVEAGGTPPSTLDEGNALIRRPGLQSFVGVVR